MTTYEFMTYTFHHIKERAARTVEEYEISDLLAPLGWCYETYPTLSVALSFVLIAYAIPISLFVACAVITATISFATFLVIEGAVLGLMLILLISVLTTLTVLLVTVSFGLWLAYMGVAQSYQILAPNSPSHRLLVPPPEFYNNHKHRHIH